MMQERQTDRQLELSPGRPSPERLQLSVSLSLSHTHIAPPPQVRSLGSPSTLCDHGPLGSMWARTQQNQKPRDGGAGAGKAEWTEGWGQQQGGPRAAWAQHTERVAAAHPPARSRSLGPPCHTHRVLRWVPYTWGSADWPRSMSVLPHGSATFSRGPQPRLSCCPLPSSLAASAARCPSHTHTSSVFFLSLTLLPR